MDGFLNLAKQGYSAYQDSQGKKDTDVKTGGGQEYSQRPPSPPGASYGSTGPGYNQGPPPPDADHGSTGQGYNQGPSPPGASYGSTGPGYNQGPSPPDAGYGSSNPGYDQGPSPPGASYGKTGGAEYNQRAPSPDGPDFDDDDDKIAARASDHAGDAGDTSLFAQALSFAKGNKAQQKEPVDEARAVDSHKVAYDEDKPSNLDANSLGSAAALQVLKQFTSGSGSGGGSKSQSQLISLAMSEAAKLFDKGGAKSGDKQEAVNGAAMTVVKLLVQSKFSGGGTSDTNKPDFSALLGGGGGGGGNQLLGLAGSYFGKK